MYIIYIGLTIFVICLLVAFLTRKSIDEQGKVLIPCIGIVVLFICMTMYAFENAIKATSSQ